MTGSRLVAHRLVLSVVAISIAWPLDVRSQSGAERPRVERTFESDRVGAPPDGWLFAQMKGAPAGRWVVQRAAQDTFLAQLGDGARDGSVVLALIDAPQAEYENVRVSARLRLAGGARTAGVVWRYQDAGNFYLASLDLAQQRIDVHRIAQGNRVRVRDREDLSLDPGAWYTLTVVHEENEIRLYLGGLRVFEFLDRALRRPGRAGVWSTANTEAHFDEVRVQPEDDHHETARRRGRE